MPCLRETGGIKPPAPGFANRPHGREAELLRLFHYNLIYLVTVLVDLGHR